MKTESTMNILHMRHRAGMRRADRARMRGTSLIEILVAVVVLSTGLLGMVALQAKALRNNQSSLERSQAVVLTYSILERMRTNAAVARTGAYNYAWSANCPAPGGGTLAATDLTNWVGEIKAGLGQGACGSIACNGNLCTISIRWDDSRGTPVPNAPTLTISTVSRL